MDRKRLKGIIKTFLTIFIVHTMICDVGAFVLGRFTTIEAWIGLPLVVAASIVLTLVLEQPWKDSCEKPGIMEKKGTDDDEL